METRKRKSEKVKDCSFSMKKKSKKVVENILNEHETKQKKNNGSPDKKSKSPDKKREKSENKSEKKEVPLSTNNIDISTTKTISKGKKSSASELKEDLNWKLTNNSVLVRNYDSKPSAKTLAFDLDDTLVHPKSGSTFAQHKDDWTFIFDLSLMKDKIKGYYDDGYRIAILSNQNGIRKGKVNEGDWKHKINSIQKDLDIPILVLAAMESDFYRKPSIGLWKILQDEFNDGIKIDKESSIYVGDAAGRTKNMKGKKDHSDCDLKFALNFGVKFMTPEEFFNGEKSNVSTAMDFEPRELKKNQTIDMKKELNLSDKQEMIILVGSPASGKSTVVKNYLVPNSYVHVNNDTLKTAAKCQKLAEVSLKDGKSVVIDNTNPTQAVRQTYISIAKKYKVPVRCFYFNYPKNLTFHMNNLRDINKVRKHQSKSVADVVIHSWYKNLEQPSITEGFQEVKEMPFVPAFENEEDEEIFYLYSTK